MIRRLVGAAWRGRRWSWLAPGLAASGVAAAYLLIDPRTSDLPAHLFRAELFGREGFAIWSNAWYGGHHVPAYSVLFPPLAWLLGPRVAGALACVAAAVLFERVVRRRYGDAARFGALWLGFGVGSLLFTNRLAFALGVAVGLGAVLALQRQRPWTAAALAALSSLASPVAGLFAALAGAAYALAPAIGTGRVALRALPGLAQTRTGGAFAVAALAPPVTLAAVFPEGGTHPLALSAYLAAPAFTAASLLLLPRTERVLRAGLALYLLGCTAAFLIETPVGGNVTRLGSLLGGPLLAAALVGRTRTPARTAVLAVALVGLAYWQWYPAARAALDARGDPSTEAAYYAPLLARLADDPPAGRLEIPFLRSHFEAAYVAEHHPLARGWERQLDIERNGLFYEGELGHREYRRWLRQNAVSHVAVADVEVDYSAEQERRLVEKRPSYLEPLWSSDHWQLFEVRSPRPLASAEGGAEVTGARLEDTGFVVSFRRPGAALVRVRWSPYWRAAGGCVEPAGQWTRVTAQRPGRVEVAPWFAPGRIAARDRRCS